MKLMPHKNTGKNESSPRGVMPLRDVMGRLFDESLWDPFGLMSGDPSFKSLFSSNAKGMNLPSVDISESKNGVVVEADIPGFKAEDIDVELEGNTLILRGRKEEKKEEEDKEKMYYLRERSESSWERRFTLPSYVDLQNIDCTSKDGKLTIRLPKTNGGENRKIKINSK